MRQTPQKSCSYRALFCVTFAVGSFLVVACLLLLSNPSLTTAINAQDNVQENEPQIITVSNSCMKKNIRDDSNEERIIQLLPDTVLQTYPLLNVQCSNEYMIIDVNKDSNWKSYFTSHRLFHYAVLGPERDDHSNWREWLMSPMTDFLVSPDCQTCDETSELQRNYGSRSAYYMTAGMAGCAQLPVGRIACDMDFITYECKVCADSGNSGYRKVATVFNGLNSERTTAIHNFSEILSGHTWKYGSCAFTIRDALAYHFKWSDDFAHCKIITYVDVEFEEIIPRRRPSLGIDGRFCMCVKSNEVQKYEEYKMQVTDEKLLELQKKEKEPITIPDANTNDDVILLSSSDFTVGTYRILSPGTYKLVEDIVFDFSAPEGYKKGNLHTYNDKYSWWPSSADADKYPGAGDKKDPYFLGFYAGISIEADDVTLDLNGHKIEMSEAFFYQQAFFALIALTSQPFLPGQGAGFFGASPVAAKNTIIKNGELGLSSHHGIQGYFNEHLLIENIKISQFKTHGIQLNGFIDIEIRNVDIGNNRIIDRLSPYYAQMRHYLPTYQSAAKTDIAKDNCLTFVGRTKCVTLQELADDAQILLDMAFEVAYFDKDWDAIFSDAQAINFYAQQMEISEVEVQRRQELWNKNSRVFLNTEHIFPQTASLYGMFLNYVGSNVIGWYAGSASVASKDVIMENVHIHDLTHNTFENIAFRQRTSTMEQRILNCLNAPFNAYHIFGNAGVSEIEYCNRVFGSTCGLKTSNLRYGGNVLTDIQIFLLKLIFDHDLSWNYCFAGANDALSLVSFAFHANAFYGETIPILEATHDPMIHPGKGVMGLRMNGVQHATLSNIKIENIWSATRKGSIVAGNYGFTASQQKPYLNAYSMNNCNGISLTFSDHIVFENDVILNNLQSDTGLVFGISVWYQSNIHMAKGSMLSISNIRAGAKVSSADYDFINVGNNLPNNIPEACAIRFYGDDTYSPKMTFADSESEESSIDISCVTGLSGCVGAGDASMVGNVASCTGENEMILEVKSAAKSISENISGKGKYYFFACALVVFLLAVATILHRRMRKITSHLESQTYSELQ